MQQIINFLIREKNFILFLLLLSFSIFLTVQSNSYHKTKYINSANWISGGIYKKTNAISEYFHLKSYNDQLINENQRLRTLVFNSDLSEKDSIIADSSLIEKYKFYRASIIKNSFSKPKNYLTLDKGTKDSIAQDMGVLSAGGIVGIIENTSN